MTIKLPKPIGDYFSIDRARSGDITRCFAENAIVKDESLTYQGLAAIKQWKMDSSKKYNYTSEPFSFEEKAGKSIVTSKLTGNFPGSPVNLNYIFSLEDGKITTLEITI
ncbi:hypothetical protein [Neptunicella sp. SCSIO 80796]|uniref:hypothetical protein n=1 Tax=Neptunicella plasticusilytica TaxID=3117012 RepID=UPI003A4D5FA9